MHRILTNNDNFRYSKSIHNKFKTKSFQFDDISIIPYPIKPCNNIIPKDINLQKIFTVMLTSSYNLSINYSNLLNNINIENNERKKIFKKIREYFISNLIEYKIYFKTIVLFDIISIENQNKKLLNSIEEIALGALMLSIKFNYDENKMFSMKKFLKLYGEHTYTLNNIIDIERKALKTINYFLNYTTPMCFLEFFMLNGIIYNVDKLGENNYHKIYKKTENVLEKIMEESNNYLKYNFFYLACSVVSYCRQCFHLDQWPFSLKKVFSIDYTYFQNEYKAYFGIKEREREREIEREIEKEKEKEKEKEIKTINNKSNIYNYSTYNCHNNKDIIINGNNNVVLLNLKTLNNNNSNSNIDDGIKYYKNNYNIYKKNNFKTINHYNNNIINININNVSLNNIYSTNAKKKFNSNRFHYNSDNNTINECFSKNSIHKSYNLYEGGVYKKSISKVKYKNRYKNKNDSKYKLTKNLEEIKEIKDYMELKPYISPHKRKRKHYYVNKEVNLEPNNNNSIQNEDKIKIENNNNIKYEYNNNIETNEIENKEEIPKNYKRKHYTYNPNLIRNNQHYENENNNILYDNGNDNDNDNNNINNNNNIGQRSQKYLNNINYENKDNYIEIKGQNSNANIINSSYTEERSENEIKYIRNYSKKIYYYNENNNNNNPSDFINYGSNKDINRNNINNINNINEEKSGKYQNYKCQSSRIGQSINKNKRMANTLYIEDKKNNDINIRTENKRNYIYKNVDKNIKEKEKINNNKKYKIENKIKYNDLIKHKLAISSYSINKRK